MRLAPAPNAPLFDVMRDIAWRSSWAVWNYPKTEQPIRKGSWEWVKELPERDGLAPADGSGDLNPAVVIVALNKAFRKSKDPALAPASASTVAPWDNFHDSARDGWLALSVRGTGAAGAYMADLVHDMIDSKSARVAAYLKDSGKAPEYVARLADEVARLGSHPRTLICCGGVVYEHMLAHWSTVTNGSSDDRIVHIRHYSDQHVHTHDVFVTETQAKLRDAGL